MEETNNHTECCKEKITKKKGCCCSNGGSGAIYGLGMFGALIYFLQNAHSFGMVIVGIGKAIFGPAVLVLKIFSLLNI